MALSLTIPRHCVAVQDHGLSPLQQALMDDPHRVRIAEAPTGAGKSYAFLRALQHGQRILFIVPTRRLAQNLAASSIRDLIHAGWSPERAESKVAFWSSDQSAELRQRGLKVTGVRLRQLLELNDAYSGGEIIFAIPETLSQLLMRPASGATLAGLSVIDILQNFDHIVFDEFHTMDARGFGLAGLFAALACQQDDKTGYYLGRARVSFLSATPLTIIPVLKRLGISDTDIVELHEILHKEGRALHGNVQLNLEASADLASLVEQQLNRVAQEYCAGRQVVIIYDRLDSLRRELSQLKCLFNKIQIPNTQVLVINSIDDSATMTANSDYYGFQRGRICNPDQFSILIATASVEIGITFRAANLLLMEPGFSSLNFLQRYGRAARKGADGEVWVRLDAHARQPWLRELYTWILRHQQQEVSIQALTQQLSASVTKEFATPCDGERNFGRLPNRAVYTTGLYWNALLSHFTSDSKRPQGELLRQAKPNSARHISALLHKIETTFAPDPDYAAYAHKWCTLFCAQAYTLRDIGQRVRIIEANGNELLVDALWLQRVTTVLECALECVADDGSLAYQLNSSFEDFLRPKNKQVKPLVNAYFPHMPETVLLTKNDLVDQWCRQLKQKHPLTSLAWEEYPEAMQAAKDLVTLTGLVPSQDNYDVPLGISSGIC